MAKITFYAWEAKLTTRKRTYNMHPATPIGIRIVTKVPKMQHNKYACLLSKLLFTVYTCMDFPSWIQLRIGNKT